MDWMRSAALLTLFWSGSGWAATLQWDANKEMDLAGYRVYRCSQQPCGRGYGTASILVTLGNVTSYNIGTPSVAQYYVITAFDTANNESGESNVVAYTPAAPPPAAPPPSPPALVPPPAPSGLRFN
jgi:hypothetical protein